MQKGFNSDIQVRGKTFHVQTEDWGQQNPYLVSRIFQNGAVLKTIKRSYAEALQNGPVRTGDAVQLALREQHHHILDELFAGRIHF
jgi:MOSC domain-containing protein YiiM